MVEDVKTHLYIVGIDFIPPIAARDSPMVMCTQSSTAQGRKDQILLSISFPFLRILIPWRRTSCPKKVTVMPSLIVCMFCQSMLL